MKKHEKVDNDSKMVDLESHFHVNFIRTGYSSSGGNLILGSCSISLHADCCKFSNAKPLR